MRINKLAIKAAFFVCLFVVWGFSVSWVFNHIGAWLITPQLLQQQFIEKWDGKTPLYGNMPITLFKDATSNK